MRCALTVMPRLPRVLSRCTLTFLLLSAVCVSSVFVPIASGQSYIFGRADFPVNGAPGAFAAADFNGDGRLDFAVITGNAVSILLGKPDGTFTAGVDYPVHAVAVSVATGDFNGDGNLDLVVTSENCHVILEGIHQVTVCDPGTVSILLGNGDGTFQSSVLYETDVNPLAVTVGDLNGDGKLDLVTANNYNNTVSTVSVLLGNGDGTFRTHVEYATDQAPASVVVADFNADHRPDLAVATAGGASILLGNGDGTFQSHSDYRVQAGPGVSLAVADFNGDGKLDFALAGGGVAGIAYIFLGDGSGAFTNAASYGAGRNPASIVSVDFNQDGKSDLAIANAGDSTVSVLLGNGDGTFQPNSDYGTSLNPVAMAAGDFNGDGSLDLAVAAACTNFSDCPRSGAVSVLLGFGDGTFVGKTDYAVRGSPASLVSVDFNHDGKLDLAGGGGNLGNSVSVLLGNGDGTFQSGLFSDTGSEPFAIATGDFNGDGNTDLVTANATCSNQPCGPGSVSILLGKGDGTFQPHVEYATGVEPLSVAVGDFNGDGKLDLAVANYNSGFGNTVSILLGNGDGTFQPHVDYFTGNGPRTVVTGDFNGDGKLDLAVGDTSVSILLGNGDGTFQPHVEYQTGGGVSSIAVADFNGDGKADLAVGGVLSILLGNGNGTFQQHVDYGTGSDINVSDFNGDGKLDLASGIQQVPGMPKASIQLGNGDGTFQAPLAYALSTQVLSSLTVGDFNGDGVPDLASSDSNLNTVSVMLSAAFKAIDPTAMDFGSQGVGTTSGVRTITLSNPSHVMFSIQGISIGGDFTGTNNCGVKLVPGAGCVISVQFSPSTTGARPGAITLTDGTRSSPQTIPLTGTGVNGPSLAVSPNRVNFAPQAIGASSMPAVIGLANTGNSVLQIAKVGTMGPNGADFSESSACGSSLAAGSNCSVSVTFKPTAAGTRRASIAISDSASASPQLVALTGAGLGPIVSLSATSLTFASQSVGTSSSPQNATITNIGGALLGISQISAAGDFVQTNNCPANLLAGVNCAVSVTFTPTSIGTRPGSLTFTDSDPTGTQVITLSGTGSGSAVTLAPTSLAFGNQNLNGTSLAQIVTLSNTGNGPLSLRLRISGQFSQTNTCGTNLAAGSSCSISVAFAPTTAGTQTGAITVTDNAAGSPHTINLSGIGIAPFVLSVAFGGSTTQAVTAGQTASYPLSVSSNNFSGAVTLTCRDPTPMSTCSVNNPIVNLTGSGSVPLTASVTTTAQSGGFFRLGGRKIFPVIPGPAWIWLLYALTLGCVVLVSANRAPRLRVAFCGGTLGLILLAGLAACGGGASSTSNNPPPTNTGTPSGTYTVTVSASAQGTTQNLSLQVVVQ